MPARKSQPIDPWSRMDKMMAASVEPTGPEWFTAADFVKRYPGRFQRQCNASRFLREQANCGILEVWKGHVRGFNATTCKYRFRPGKDAA